MLLGATTAVHTTVMSRVTEWQSMRIRSSQSTRDMLGGSTVAYLGAQSPPQGGLGAGLDEQETTNVFDHLRSFIRVCGPVCGTHSECSLDLHELLAITADGLADA